MLQMKHDSKNDIRECNSMPHTVQQFIMYLKYANNANDIVHEHCTAVKPTDKN